MSDAIGHGHVVAFKKAAANAAWGPTLGSPVACGAGNQIPVDSVSITTDSSHLENMGITGNGQQLPGVKGHETVNGEITIDLLYEGVHVPMAMALGALTAPVQIGASTAYLAVQKPVSSGLGTWGTLAMKNDIGVEEFPWLKIGGFEITCEENQRAKVKFPYMSRGLYYNTNAANTAALVASVLPANGAQIIIAGGNTSLGQSWSPVILTIVDGDASISALSAAIVYKDLDGSLISETWTFVPGTLTYTTKRYVSNLVSITLSGVVGASGADRITAGYTGGVNTVATMASATLGTNQDPAVFPHMKLYVADQSDAGTSMLSFEQFVTKMNLKFMKNLVEQVTSEDGRRINEPRSNGFLSVEGGFSFDLLTGPETATAQNISFLRDYLKKNPKRLLIEFRGPDAGSANPNRWSFYLNNCIFTGTAPGLDGPGKRPLDITFKAHRALAAPASFPAGYTDMITAENVNTVTSNYMA